MLQIIAGTQYLTLNSIRGPFRPESSFAYTQHWYLADETLQDPLYFTTTFVWMTQANKNPKT